MADPIGITFLPSAEAAANGPQQAGIEGQGGSDLAQAFKILSLHLPRVLGASAIAPKRLLTSQGSAAVAGPTGSSPYAAVFEALLHSLGAGSMGGGMSGGTGGSMGPQSLSSLFGGSTSDAGTYGSGGGTGGTGDGGGGIGGPYGSSGGGAPPPVIVPGSGGDLPRDGSVTPPPPTSTFTGYTAPYTREDTQSI